MTVEYSKQIKIICGQIRELRIKKGLSVQELANRCEIERSNLSRIEAGRSNLTIKTMLKISEALNVPISHFF